MIDALPVEYAGRRGVATALDCLVGVHVGWHRVAITVFGMLMALEDRRVGYYSAATRLQSEAAVRGGQQAARARVDQPGPGVH